MHIKLKPVSEQVIVVTGASSGIGLVTARAAAKAGAKVVLVARSREALEEIVRGIEADGGTATSYACDVGDADAVEAAAAYAVERFGRIDTWVSNAGSAIYGTVLGTPLEDQHQLFRTNYFGAVHGALAAVPRLRDAGGALITVGSLASDMPAPPMGVYSATKHAVKAYVEVLRMELAEEGAPISVTLIKPAGIDTPIGQHAENVLSDKEAQLPPPVYDPAAVADAILFAAANPKRELTVGGVGKAQILFAQHFPWIYEALAPKADKYLFSPTKPQPKPSNLHGPARAGEERSGEHPERMRGSLYTKASERPALAAAGFAAVVGLAVGGFALARRGRA
jgi:short-subunit dehydrogenase